MSSTIRTANMRKRRTFFRFLAVAVLRCENEFSNRLHEGNFDGDTRMQYETFLKPSAQSRERLIEIQTSGGSHRNKSLELHCVT